MPPNVAFDIDGSSIEYYEVDSEVNLEGAIKDGGKAYYGSSVLELAEMVGESGVVVESENRETRLMSSLTDSPILSTVIFDGVATTHKYERR